MEGSSALNWRKSSRSGNNGGDCVEAASTARRILVRDTKQDGHGPVLAFTPQAWHAFAAKVKTDTAT